MPYEIRFTKEAIKDINKLSSKLKKKSKEIAINQITEELYRGKKLIGDLSGFFSIRLSYKDRIIYSINEKDHTVFIHRAKIHYGD
ncbi:MAG: type II toxin-antitoxin system YoeB family toxin [Candidatus Brocadiaceae bacterium]|nr:type II toxin-antitoxin system YoeB family toxin [Candidatus Brocadiaceae bacterium]